MNKMAIISPYLSTGTLNELNSQKTDWGGGAAGKELNWLGSAVDRNLPASVEDMSLIPGLGRFHTQLSPCATTAEPRAHMLQLLKPTGLEPVLHKRCPHSEEPMHCSRE